MIGLLETSVLVRYLTGDPSSMSEVAARIIESDADLGLTDVVIAETAYVLTSVYQVPRNVVVDHLVDFIQRRNIRSLGIDKDKLVQALMMCRASSRVAFADALLWAQASASGSPVYSFDDRFPRAGVEVRTTLANE